MNRSTDIRVIRTQSALIEALEELIKTKKLSCITITELCTKAGINRNTFYYHYNNIYELLDDNKAVLINELNNVLDVNKSHSKSTLIDFCKCIRKYPHFLNILISPNCDLEYFNDIFVIASEKTKVFVDKPRDITSSKDIYIAHYCNAGCNAVITEWIMNGMKETPEEVADIIFQASNKGPLPLLFPDK